MSEEKASTIGFACRWDRHPEGTWSGTPWKLREALRRHTAVADIDVSPPVPVQAAFKAWGMRRSHGQWKSLWRHSRPALEWNERSLARKARAADVDAVISIQDLGRTSQPLYMVQDLSYGLLRETFGEGSIPHFRTLGHQRIRQLQRRQHELWDAAAGLFPFSDWLARSMVGEGVPESKITVVNPGVNIEVAADAPVVVRREGRPFKLLMVGRDFDTKAGDQVVAAFEILRQRMGAEIELTVIGPPVWPLDHLPDGLTFLGPQGKSQVDAAFASHDLFVMPSRFEGFGIAFVEALVRGMPVIARNAFAMPEIIDPRAGRLIESDEAGELSDVVQAALLDDGLFADCAASAPERRAHYTWDRAARQMLDVLQAPAR